MIAVARNNYLRNQSRFVTDLQIKGKKALDTGASADIGLKIARTLVIVGDSVIGLGRDQVP